MNQTVVLTGANRGIGLALAEAWQARGDAVIAVCRQASPALRELDVTCVEGIDVGDDAAMPRLREALADTDIDILYNNAGVMLNETVEDLDLDRIRRQLEINTLGPLRVTRALLDRMAGGGKIGLMTSRMGSIEDNDSGGKYGYRISKTGLNAAGKSLAVDLAPRGIAVAILHPGWVRTEMTGDTGHIDATEAAERLVQRMDELNLGNSGTFWHSDGTVLPW